VEVIEFTDPTPAWTIVGSIQQPLSTTKAVLLPDGKVLIGHGINRGNCTITEGGTPRPCTFSEKEGHFFQMFDPVTHQVRQLARTTVSRGLHGTATLLPDGSVFFAGENREALVRPDDPAYPLQASWAQGGTLLRGDPDQGVPVGQLFFPPYLFTGSNGERAARPAILDSPRELSYRGSFDVTVDAPANTISSVVLLRSDHNTHSLTAGDRYVKLAFQVKGNPRDGVVRVVSPTLPAQAVPGIYMLFVLDQDGVPSVGQQVRLKPETRGAGVAFR